MNVTAPQQARRIEFDATFADIALSLADVFRTGGRLLVTAPGRDDHAQHVAVEFVHPVIAGKPALPAIACDPAALSNVFNPGDAVLLLATSPKELETVNSQIPFGARVFEVVADESTLVQRYHILWEAVHLCLEYSGSSGMEQTDAVSKMLYPFLTSKAVSTDELHNDKDVVTAIHSSTMAKIEQAKELAVRTMSTHEEHVKRVAELIVTASTHGTIYTIGNGGSSCDAARLVRLLGGGGVRSVCLPANYATLSALANDIGVERIFARMIDGIASSGDVLIAFSTSGASKNLLNGFEAAKKKGLHTVGFAGYGGGQFVSTGTVDHVLAVDSDSVHRIQEVQGALIDAICKTVIQWRSQ